jgi:hypothetical protein
MTDDGPRLRRECAAISDRSAEPDSCHIVCPEETLTLRFFPVFGNGPQCFEDRFHGLGTLHHKTFRLLGSDGSSPCQMDPRS